jgi:carbohydrate diacid regulator
MLNVSARFAQVANTIASRISELLYAPVVVINDRGIVITSSDSQQVGKPFQWNSNELTINPVLHIPLCYESETGEVIIGESINREMVSGRLVQALVELVVQEARLQTNSFSKHELKNQLIYDLLLNRVRDESVILERAKHLGIDLNPPRAVILIDAADFILKHSESGSEELIKASQQHRSKTIINSIVNFFHLPNDTICAYLDQGRIAVLKASDSKNLDHWADGTDVSGGLGSSWANLAALRRAADALLQRLCGDTQTVINIGIGRYHPGIRGLAQSYEDARAAISLGSRFKGHNRVHCLGELGIAAFVGVADEGTKIDLAKYLLSPLDHEPELLTTLDVFFGENCCPSSAAKRLSIHRNTLGYRLDKIMSLTGLDPRRFDDATQMRLSLLLRSLS